jgi:cytochrome c peroxidase
MIKKRIFLTFALATFFMASTAMAGNLSSMEILGKKLYNDTNLSLNGNQSCQTCHHQSAKFADPENRMDPVALPVSDGSDPTLFGGRNAPTAAYAGFSPPLDCVPDGEGGLFCTGGLFWDGRATGLDVTDTGGIEVDGEETGPTMDPLADQAKGPFQNPIEMALIPEQVIAKVRTKQYATLFKNAFGLGYDIFATPGHVLYNDIGIAIAAFERSTDVNKFSSRFDMFAVEQAGIDVSTIVLNNTGVVVDAGETPITSAVFTQQELQGLALFNMPNNNDGILELWEGGNCAACHPSGPITDPTDSMDQTLFTDFTYDNLGVPLNPIANTLHYGSADPVTWDTDWGLYATLTGLLGYTEDVADGTRGLFKVSTLRNVARTAPYAHNGFFATLTDIVNFYNTRDVPGSWPVAEVPKTVNSEELGNLGLSPLQVDALVAFMNTLTDTN